MHTMPTTQAEDESPAMKQRREILNASIGEIYHHLCTVTLGVIAKCRKGMKQEQMKDLAEEAVHEGICRALARAEKYDPSRRAAPWIMKFILLILKEKQPHRRKNQTQTDVGEIAWTAALDTCETGIPSQTHNERASQLEWALAKIKPAERDILRLRFNEGLDGEQLAEALGATNGTARTRLSRALQSLRAAVKALPNQEEKP